jgi:hypothetical protein
MTQVMELEVHLPQTGVAPQGIPYVLSLLVCEVVSRQIQVRESCVSLQHL